MLVLVDSQLYGNLTVASGLNASHHGYHTADHQQVPLM